MTTGITQHSENLPLWLKNFLATYTQLNTKNLDLLNEVYDASIEFEDPLHMISGLDELRRYFDNLYSNLSECTFVITDVIHDNESAAIYWTMTYRHTILNGGKPVEVEGHSRLKGKNGYVHYHRDYLDLGAMLYEHIPVIGSLVKQVKRRAGR